VRCLRCCRPCTQLCECVACLVKGCIQTGGRGAGEKGEEGSECVACDAAVHACNCVKVLCVASLGGALIQGAEVQRKRKWIGEQCLVSIFVGHFKGKMHSKQGHWDIHCSA